MQTNPSVIAASEDALSREVSLNKGAREVLDQNLRDFFEEHEEEGYDIQYEITEGAADSAAAAGEASNVGDTVAGAVDAVAGAADPNAGAADPNAGAAADPNAGTAAE